MTVSNGNASDICERLSKQMVPAFRHGAAVAEARAPRPLLFPNPWEYAVEAIISWADAHPFLIVCKPRPVVRIRIRRYVVRIRIGDAAISVTVVVRTGENTTDWDLLPFRRKIMDNNSKSTIPAYFLPTALCAFSLFRFALLWLL